MQRCLKSTLEPQASAEATQAAARRTYLRFKDQGGSDFTPIVVAAGEVELRFGGDAELRNLIRLLRFAADVLDGTIDDVPARIASRIVA